MGQVEKPLLSICIPTYNMGRFLNESLQLFLYQTDNFTRSSYEICISDNHSTDETIKIVRQFQHFGLPLRYQCHTSNIGPDKNFLTAVSMASGKYCWLFGADDAPAPDSLQNILKELRSNDDIYLCNRILCDKNLHPLQKQFWLNSHIPSMQICTSDMLAMQNYLKHAESIGALFSFMSANIFRQSLWESVKVPDRLMRTSYMHVVKLLTIVNRGCHLRYLKKHHVLCRGDNDSFLSSKWQRLYLDFDSYNKIIKATLNKDKQKYFKAVMKQEHPFYRLVRLRSLAPSQSEWLKAKRLLLEYGYPKLTIRCAEILGKNTKIIDSMVNFRNHFCRQANSLLKP